MGCKKPHQNHQTQNKDIETKAKVANVGRCMTLEHFQIAKLLLARHFLLTLTLVGVGYEGLHPQEAQVGSKKIGMVGKASCGMGSIGSRCVCSYALGATLPQ